MSFSIIPLLPVLFYNLPSAKILFPLSLSSHSSLPNWHLCILELSVDWPVNYTILIQMAAIHHCMTMSNTVTFHWITTCNKSTPLSVKIVSLHLEDSLLSSPLLSLSLSLSLSLMNCEIVNSLKLICRYQNLQLQHSAYLLLHSSNYK